VFLPFNEEKRPKALEEKEKKQTPMRHKLAKVKCLRPGVVTHTWSPKYLRG
jgi:hypothetical protein